MNKYKPLLVSVFCLIFTFCYSRLLVNTLGAGNPWTSYLYMYGFGFMVFIIGMYMIRTTGACVPGRGREGIWYKFLIAGFIFFLSFHGLWILLALYMPSKVIS